MTEGKGLGHHTVTAWIQSRRVGTSSVYRGEVEVVGVCLKHRVQQLEENRMPEPRKIVMEDGEVFYNCTECENEVTESGECFESDEPCYYCPPDVCTECGRGSCDQSC